VADGVRRYAESRARTVILRPPEDEADIEGDAQWVGRVVMRGLGPSSDG